MFSEITFGQYYPSGSVFHKMDGRVKIILCLLFTVTIFLAQSAVSVFALTAVNTVIILLTKIPIKTFWKNLKPLIPLLLITGVLNLFYVNGNVIASFWVFKISDQGVKTAVFVIIRICILVLSTSVLTYSTTPTELTDSIERLFSFLKYIKVDIHSFAMMMTIALRFIPILVDEVNKITNAQKARGADLETGGIIKRCKALIPIFIPLFISAFRRAYDLAFAMECRCYHGGDGRTKMKVMKCTYIDYISLVLVCVVMAGIILLNFVKIGGY